MGFTLTCGVLLWPLEFVITDIINEFYGPKVVRRISYTAIALIAYAFLMYFMAIHVPAADSWIASSPKQGVPNLQDAFSAIFGNTSLIIVGTNVGTNLPPPSEPKPATPHEEPSAAQAPAAAPAPMPPADPAKP